MEKEARIGFEKIPGVLRKFFLGRPNINIWGKMSPIAKARLSGGRHLLEKEVGLYKKLSQDKMFNVLKDKALLGAAAGSALGAGSLAWSLAKENPETDSRLARLLTALLFVPEGEMDQIRESTQEGADRASQLTKLFEQTLGGDYAK